MAREPDPASVAAGEAAGRSQARVRIPQTTCFWTGEGSSKFGIGRNFALPDTGAAYWSAQITMLAGSWIVFTGRSRMPDTLAEHLRPLHTPAMGASTRLVRAGAD
jgi:hypothetical protein